MRGFLIFLLVGFLNESTFAQFSPPGMGDINNAIWMAVGIKNDIGHRDRITSTTYFGVGRTSVPHGYNPLRRGAVYVVNQEFTFRHTQHWKYSAGMNYGWQNQFKTTAPLERVTSGGRSEVRYFAKITYEFGEGIFKYSFTYRPEIRTFFNSDFTAYKTPLQLRSRLKGQVKANLNEAETQKVIVAFESLFAKSKNENWEAMRYTDTRICLYYALSPKNTNLTFNIGYMNNLIGRHNPKGAHYLALDVLWHIPS